MRYHIARGFVEPADTVLDAASGCGYGSEMLASLGCRVIALERDSNLIEEHAKKVHNHGNIDYREANLEAPITNVSSFDTGVSLETIEHLENPTHLVSLLKQARGWIIVSVPHAKTVGINPFHRVDYTENELVDLFQDENWLYWHSIKQGIHGIYVFRRIK
jgi:2-polyprenyl-3-methyl-5-hydroxy-6-metoxy-1,4-benzoquinol methylase